MADEVLDLVPLPPERAVSYLRDKGYQFSWDWHEMWQGEHARAFTVAKVTKLDILHDIKAALDKAQAEGTTFEQFKNDLVPLLQRKGWWGRKEAVNLTTGETREVQLGSLHRLRTIFNVNIQTSLQVGHYQAMTAPAVLKARPYWRYSAVMDGRTRPLHRQWNGIILPATSPWWDTHFPPNGWNCRCTVVSMSMREISRDGLQVSPEPDVKMREWTDPAGKIVQVPEGIDPGWDYNAGKAAAAQTQAMAGEKVLGAPAPLRWKLLDDLRSEDLAAGFRRWTDALLSPENQFAPGKYRTTGATIPVDHLSQNLVEKLEAMGYPPETTAITISDSEWFHLQHAEQPAESKRPATNILSREQALRLPDLMRESKAVVWDQQNPALLYVFDTGTAGEVGKVAVRVNMYEKRTKTVGNSIRTAELVKVGDVKPGSRYRVLEGEI